MSTATIVGVSILSVLGLALVAALARTLATPKAPRSAEPLPESSLEEAAGVELALARAVRFATVSSYDESAEDESAFAAFKEELRTLFPAVHASMRREDIGRRGAALHLGRVEREIGARDHVRPFRRGASRGRGALDPWALFGRHRRGLRLGQGVAGHQGHAHSLPARGRAAPGAGLPPQAHDLLRLRRRRGDRRPARGQAGGRGAGGARREGILPPRRGRPRRRRYAVLRGPADRARRDSGEGLSRRRGRGSRLGRARLHAAAPDRHGRPRARRRAIEVVPPAQNWASRCAPSSSGSRPFRPSRSASCSATSGSSGPWSRPSSGAAAPRAPWCARPTPRPCSGAAPRRTCWPTRASAIVNVRILPGESSGQVLARLARIAGKRGATVRPAHPDAVVEPLPESPGRPRGLPGDRGRPRPRLPGGRRVPFLFSAGTDTKHYRAAAQAMYRLTPLRQSSDQLEGVHGRDERIEIC